MPLTLTSSKRIWQSDLGISLVLGCISRGLLRLFVLGLLLHQMSLLHNLNHIIVIFFYFIVLVIYNLPKKFQSEISSRRHE